MLFALGALQIDVTPFNVHETSELSRASFAEKPVVGALQPLEFVGDGGTEFNLSGRLFPYAIGGMGELAILEVMRQSGKPQYLMRGDGTPMGWWVVESTEQQSEYLGPGGVGKKIEISITLKKASAPPAQSFYSLFAGWF